MHVELDVFSGRPNPAWDLDADGEADFLARLQLLKPNRSEPSSYDGLGYRGFRVEGVTGYNRLTIFNGTAEAWDDGRRYSWLDETKSLEKFLLQTAKTFIDPALFRTISSMVESDGPG